MSGFDWKGVVSSVAPLLGGALGGPFGAMAAKKVAGALLGNEDATEDELEQAIVNATPDQLLALKKADHDFKTTMKELGIKEEQLHVEDRGSARKMAINTTLVPQMIISVIFVTAFSVILYTVFTQTLKLDDMQKNIIMYLLGILSAGLVQVMNFWFGSSSGSKTKTLQMEK